MRLLHFHFKSQNRLPKGTVAKHDVCPGSSASGKVPAVDPAELAPTPANYRDVRHPLCYLITLLA